MCRVLIESTMLCFENQFYGSKYKTHEGSCITYWKLVSGLDFKMVYCN